MEKGKVSVVVALYNCERYIDKCIESILNQTYQNFEIIICDDCSTDNSYKLAENWSKKDKRVIAIKNEENRKSAYTRNKCIEISTGEYIAIQDADDYSDITRFEKQVDILNREQDMGFVSSSMYRVNENGIWDEIIAKKEYPSKKDFLKSSPFAHGAAMFRANIIKEIGGYKVSENTVRTEDLDLFIRLCIEGYKGKNIFEPLYYYNENIDAYLRKKYRDRIEGAKVRYIAYKELKLMPIGLLYVIKPLIIGLIPRRLLYRIKKKRGV